jgi:DNA mismatch repair protein MutS
MKKYFKIIFMVAFVGSTGMLSAKTKNEVAATKAQAALATSTYKKVAASFLPAKFSVAQKKRIKARSGDSKKSLSERELHSMVYGLFARHAKWGKQFDTSVISDNTMEELEVYSGPEAHRHLNLVSPIDRTKTITGQANFVRMLSQPQVDGDVLRERQAFIKSLVEKEELFSLLDEQSTELQKLERSIYDFYDDKFGVYSGEGAGGFFAQGSSLNKSERALGIWNRLDEILPVTGFLSFEAMAFAYLCYKSGFLGGAKEFGVAHKMLCWDSPKMVPGAVKFCGGWIKDQWTGENGGSKASLMVGGGGALLGVTAVAAGVGFYVSKLRKKAYRNKQLRDQLVDLSKVLEMAQETSETLHKEMGDSTYFKKLLKPIDDLLVEKKHMFADVEEVIKLLFDDEFDPEDETTFRANYGKIFKTLYLVKRLRTYLIPILEVLGEIEVYVSIASLVKEYKEKPLVYSFVDFVTDADRPELRFDGFWYPTLLHHQDIADLIPNTVLMGSGSDESRNIILTGPNAAGKSTFLKGVATAILMSQAFGIAPASSARMTPFSTIQTYINIADNSAEGDSLFKAELKRSSSLVEKVNKLAKNQFAFTVLDELYSGTSAEEAIVGSGHVTERLCGNGNTNSMAVFATHFRMLTRLEPISSGLFKNYKVGIERAEDGTIIFPYTITRGISDQHITLELVKQQGVFGEKDSRFAMELEKCLRHEGVN